MTGKTGQCPLTGRYFQPCGVISQGRTRAKLVNHEPKASDLQDFQVLSKNSKWVIKPVNPQKVWSISFIK